MDDWMTEPSGPYRVCPPDGTETTLTTRAELWERLAAMTETERKATMVDCPYMLSPRGWRYETGQYVYEALAMHLEIAPR